ncbi:Uncharacterized protein HZ326_21324 [Fusarium oxysporum f. sp. albedinis]|nr:Uncharacterized protein HZ326_21324 [Fusarium oxysporum f. sp. albedinis]
MFYDEGTARSACLDKNLLTLPTRGRHSAQHAFSNARWFGIRGWGLCNSTYRNGSLWDVDTYNHQVRDLVGSILRGTWGCLPISHTLKGCRRYAISGSGTILSRFPYDMLGGVNKGLSVGIKASKSGL